jgi:lipopolysaccharide export system permease protein
VVFIFLLQFLWLYIDEIVGKGLAWHLILEFLLWVAVYNLSMSLPLSTLFASLMTMGNLGENNEILAMKSSGISLHRILHPLYWTIGVLSLFAFMLSSEFVPFAYLKMRTMLQEIKRTSPELSIPEDIFYDGIDKISLRVNKKNPVTGALSGIMIYNHRNTEGNVSVTIADTAYIKQTSDSRYILFRLINGTTYSESLTNNRIDKRKYPFDRRSFTEQTISIDLGETEIQSFENMFKDNALAKSIVVLNRDIDSLSRKQSANIVKYETEQLSSPSMFRHMPRIDSGAPPRNAALNIDVDSLFGAASASEKIQLLDQAMSTVSRVMGFQDNMVRDLQYDSKRIKGMRYERHKKFTLAFACIIFFLIGAPLGAIIGKGGLGLSAVISIFFFVFYWVLETICRKMVQSGDWSPVVGAWFSSCMLAPLAVFLTVKANTDSQLFNSDAYRRFFDTVFGRMKKLVVPVDLDKISLMPEELREAAQKQNSDNVAQFETLARHCLAERRRIRRRKSGVDTLPELTRLYERILAFYVTMENDKIRASIKNLLSLNPAEFTIPPFLNSGKFLPRQFARPIIFFIRMRQAKKLEYILGAIVEITTNVNNYINDRHKV